MIDLLTAPYAVFILRLCLGIMFIAHAMLKWRVFTIPGTIAFFQSLGLPGWLAYITIATELGGAACLIVGIYPRYVSLLLIPLMIGTIVTVHGKKGWLFSNPDGGWEYPAFWSASLFVLFFCLATELGRFCHRLHFPYSGDDLSTGQLAGAAAH